MYINYRKWDMSGILFECDGVKYLAAPEDLVLPDSEETQEGSFDQHQAKNINCNLASGWSIPTHAQMLEMIRVCKDMHNGRSYWINNADDAYNPAYGRSVPQLELDREMLTCRIRCVCSLYLVME